MPLSVTITWRQRPPTRRSISTTVTSPRLACHQRATSSGVVHARHTRCFGASNSLVIRICLSVGSVSVAVPLAVILAISFLLLGELAEHGVQLLEAVLPQLPVGAQPVVHGLQRVAVAAVQPLPPRLPDTDDPDLPEHAQMLGHLRLGHTHRVHQVVDGPLTVREDVEDLAP